ncbi:MAG: DNA primase [Phycisphaerales bacterium]|nr:DNA primase [Phycisphaerales bacterium]
MSFNAPQPNDDIQRVRDASDIVGVIGDCITLKPKGREYVCLCPFHDDHSPSMCVVPAKQIFHCFVCGAGGDVFTFAQRYHSMDFREALTFLAERGNIELTPFKPKRSSSDDPSEYQEFPAGSSKQDILRANEQAQSYFRALYNHPEHGQSARDLVKRRGMTDDIVERFGIGTSADRWDGLLMTIQSKNTDTQAFSDAGLLKTRDNGGEYDALRNRLIFPICDQIGRVVAFGGRRINDDDDPKYLNSPETLVFNKSRTLYGLNLAQQAIKRKRVAVIVEGYTDVIACHQNGVEYVVATLGTALTKGHATILRRLCDTVVLLFDGDQAGQRAADRAIEVLFSETIDIKIAALSGYTDAKDPDELFAQPDGVEIFNRVIDNAVDLLKWRFDRLRAELSGAGAARVTQRIEEEIRTLLDLGIEKLSPMRRQLMIRQIASAADVSEQVVKASLRLGRRTPQGSESTPRPATEPSTTLTARETLMGCLLSEPKLWTAMSAEEHDLLMVSAFDSPSSQMVAQALHESVENGTGTGLHQVLSELAESQIEPKTNPENPEETVIDPVARATFLCRTVEQQSEGSDERLTRLMRECVRDVALSDAQQRPAHPAPAHEVHDQQDEIERLRAFAQQQQAMRERFGTMRGKLSSGDSQ